MGDRLHRRGDAGGGRFSARPRSAPTRGGGSSCSASLPALLTLWIRRYVHEPEAWTRTPEHGRGAGNPFAVIFGPGLLGRTLLIILLGSAVQFAYWGIFFWLPAFLARPVAQGGAGMGVVGSLGGSSRCRSAPISAI